MSETWAPAKVYGGELFPGQVKKVYSQGARVKSFEKCAGGRRWRKQIDNINSLPQDIKKKIQFQRTGEQMGVLKCAQLTWN